MVSCVITTKNEETVIEALLESIKKQSYKDLEIIVVDNNSDDKTKKIAKKAGAKVFNKGPERSVQRNYGVSKANGKYVLILDADMVLTKNVLRECVKKVDSNKKLGALIIPEKSFGEGFWTKCKAFERDLNRGEEYFEAARFFPKKIFNEFGGYDTNLTGPEDWDLPQRISKKYKIARIDEFINHNEGKTTLSDLAKRKYYYGLSVHEYLKKQKIPIVGHKTVYFLRRGFYKNWKNMVRKPILTFGMVIMLVVETFGGGLGYLIGRYKK